MIRYAQNIDFSMRLSLSVHSYYAYKNHSAQYYYISVHFIKPMHKHCAINQVFAQNIKTIVCLRETKELCN